jgi:hypothetical protein
MGKRAEHWFLKVQIAKNYEEILNIPDPKEMQIKTILRFHLTPVKMIIIKNTNNNKCGKDVGKKEHSHTVENVN